MRIGIIGRGFVGAALQKFLFFQGHDVESYDILDEKQTSVGYMELVQHSEIIYVCLPTPSDSTGRCDTSIVKGALDLLDWYARANNKMIPVLIKSTLVPGTTDRLQKDMGNLILVSNPEFLTERFAESDIETSHDQLLGIPDPHCNPIRDVLEGYCFETWRNSTVTVVPPLEAELIKYLTNSYFAVKVSLANQFYDLCEQLGVKDFSLLMDTAIEVDPRLGPEHWQVPGHDGRHGFGGSCFPKDLSGMIKLMEDKKVPSSVFQAAQDYNKVIRGAACPS
jgi:UDPglucose 6-dehydrogenase